MSSFVPLVLVRFVKRNSNGIKSVAVLDALHAQSSQVDFFVKSL
ncbi:MAG: hypothetical protein RL169_1818 [Armatimonadota bacterium]